MTEYKVIKKYGILDKGDMLTWNEDKECYSVGTRTQYKVVLLGEDIVKAMYKDGYLEPMHDNNVDEVIEFIDELVEQYNEDLETNQKEFEEGEIQQCVKVETETVLHNLIKLATEIKNRLKNEQISKGSTKSCFV